MSKHHSGLTSCFLDVILIPLASWVYLLAVFISLILSVTVYRNRAFSREGKYSSTGYSPDSLQPRRGKVAALCKKLTYAFGLIAVVAIVSLELARLVAAKRGIGLLPFAYPAIVIAAVLRFTNGLGGRIRSYVLLNALLWVLLLIFSAVKIATEVKIGVKARKGTKYPNVDELTDVSILLFLYAIMLLLEFWR
jgi:hypothetical protein